MAVGKRKRDLITLQRRGTAQDAAGQRIEQWTKLRQEWADIQSVSGREYFNASGDRATLTHRITIASGSGVAPRDRVVYGARTFDIDAVVPVGSRGVELELMCVEVL